MAKKVKLVLDRIVSLEDVAKRDGCENGREWMLKKCGEAIRAKKFDVPWDGETLDPAFVLATINHGRWGARCMVCNASQYVSRDTPIMFCLECGNGNSGKAWGVKFPEDAERIEAALLAREVIIPSGRNYASIAEMAMWSKPKDKDLPRNWRPGISADELEDENNDNV